MSQESNKVQNAELELEALKFQSRFSTVMLCVGFIVVLLGFGLLIAGMTGAVELVVEADNFSGKLTNASPGVVFTLLGVLVIRWSRILIGIHRSQFVFGKLSSTSSVHVNHGIVSDKSDAIKPGGQLDWDSPLTSKSSRRRKTRG